MPWSIRNGLVGPLSQSAKELAIWAWLASGMPLGQRFGLKFRI